MPAAWFVATGTTRPIAGIGPSGVESRHHTCPVCTTRLWSENDARPGFVVLRIGTLDETSMVEPRAHIWVQSKQRWLDLPADVPQFAQMEPLADFLAILGRPSV